MTVAKLVRTMFVTRSLLVSSLLALVACTSSPTADPDQLVADGVAHTRYTERPEFGTLMLRVAGDRLYRLQSARAEDGEHRRRFVVETLGESVEDLTPAWRFPAAATTETSIAPNTQPSSMFTATPAATPGTSSTSRRRRE